MTQAFHSIVTWQKGSSGYMCRGFPLQKKESISAQATALECLRRGEILMWRHLRFSSAPTEARVPGMPCLHVGWLFFDLLFGLEPVSSSVDEQQPEVEKLFVIWPIIHVIIRHTSTHIYYYFFCLAQCFRITLATSEKVKTRTWLLGQNMLR